MSIHSFDRSSGLLVRTDEEEEEDEWWSARINDVVYLL
jgi:hypothetical protein